ncbi:MAG: oligopeptide/dipeptide ABC transporter ATP-binding protein [Acutalibacteraceae bacterium]
MYAGSIVEYGSKTDVLNHPKHPYTKALIASIPQIGGTIPKGIQGQPPAFGEIFTGCSFSPRCGLCDDICTHEKPIMHSCENGHAVFCHKCLSEV